MQQQTLVRAAVSMALVVLSVLVIWEFSLRQRGHNISYDDGAPLWSDKRAKVYQDTNKAVVFIGSSRIKFDLDIPTWQSVTGKEAVQLAIEGSSPLPVLFDLANDPNFKGRLVVDATEGLFFTIGPSAVDKPNKNIKYYHDRTPAQRASFVLNRWIESKLVFLDKEHFSLSGHLDALEIPSRPGVFMMPIFPVEFDRNSFDRQMYMTDRFLADTALQHRVSGIWKFFGEMAKKAPPTPQETLDAIFQSVKEATDKIRSRGGVVIFIRPPSSGPALMGESFAFPRETYWDRLLALTGCPGIHFADYPSVAHFVCPEDSHLSPADAVIYTRHLIETIK